MAHHENLMRHFLFVFISFVTMKKLLFALFALGFCLTASADKFEKFYRQSLHAEGLLYFVLPQKMAVLGAQEISYAPLTYDYTCLDSRDSVSLLATLTTGEVFRPDSLHITAVSCEISCPVEVIYYQPAKKQWECRLRVTIPYEQWEAMYASTEPFVFEFSSPQNGARISFSDTPRKWPKIRSNFLRLQEMIRLNKK